MNSYNLTNVVEKPTRVTDRSGTLLDPVLISDTLSSVFDDVLQVSQLTSDHDAPIVFLDCPIITKRKYKREVWLYERMDRDKISEKLQEADWNTLLSDKQNIDEMSGKFNATFLKIARECIPTKQVTVRTREKPWFNNDMRKELGIRDRLRKKNFSN